jgi:hypothetical protein
MALKEKLMNKMMDNQFSNMSAEEKKLMMDSMMEKFFDGLTDEDKREMMSSMMPKMMEGMMGGQGQHPMMGMMMGMMGKKGKNHKMPWDMCQEMMTGFQETASTAKFATPELRGLFNEWCEQVESEIIEYVEKEGKINVTDLSATLKLTEESIKYLLNRLASKGLIKYHLEKEKPAGKSDK